MVAQHTRIRFGRTELQVSPICYGAWQASPAEWGEQPRDVLVQAIRRAFDTGINFFDTADIYGEGRSEQIVGEALSELPRDQVVLCTKVGRRFYPDGRRHADFTRQYLLDECEAQLRRLRTDYADVYLLHFYNALIDIEEATAALEQLKKAGKVRHYGLSNYTVEQFRMARAFGDYEVAQPKYSLAHTELEKDLLPYCKAEDIGVMVYSPLARGLLTGKYNGDETFDDLRKNSPDFQGETFKNYCQAVRDLRPIAEKCGLTIVQLALTAALMHPAVQCAIVGIKKPYQIEEAAGAMGKALSIEDYEKVRNTLSV